MKKLIAMLFSFGLVAALSFHGHCAPVKIEKVKTEYPVYKLEVAMATPATTPVFVYQNLVVALEATSILRTQAVRSGAVMDSGTGLFVSFPKKGSDFWRSKKIIVFTRNSTHRNKAIPFDPDEDAKWRSFISKANTHLQSRVNQVI